MLKEVARFDKGTVRGDAKITDEGYIKANAVVTRSGVFLYKNPDGTVRRELRHPDDVLKEDSLVTMKMIPVTNGHPKERLVTAENAKRLAVGYTGESVSQDGQYLMSNLVITDADAVKDVIENNRKELSLGYTVDLIPEEGSYQGEPYDYRQTNIKYNHLSIVDTARAGPEARIALDSNDAVEISLKEEASMAKRKVKIDNEEYMVEPEAADHIEKLQEDLKNLRDEKARVEEEIKMIEGKLEKTSAERDSMKEKVSNLQTEMEGKMDAMDVRKQVRERLKLHKMAERVLDPQTLSKLDEMNDMEVKKSIILICEKNANLDGKSDIYIQARFDAVCENMPREGVKYTHQAGVKVPNHDMADSEISRNKLVDKLKNAHKGG